MWFKWVVFGFFVISCLLSIFDSEHKTSYVAIAAVINALMAVGTLCFWGS